MMSKPFKNPALKKNMNNLYLKYFLFGTLLIASCQNDQSVEDTTNQSSSTTLFVEKNSTDTNLTFSNDLNPDTTNNILEYLYYYNGGGVAIGDINNDGLEDVLLTANEAADKLFLNQGDFKFEDITQKSGLTAMSNWSTGVSMDDVNGDGLLDIYICKVAPLSAESTHNLLYINNGDATFTESAQKYGLAFSGYATQAAFFDYDLDGDLDVYLLNHSIHSIRSYGKISKRKEKAELSGDRLFENKLNEVDGRFVDVTESAGIYSSALGYGLAIITNDLNNDGLPDIYVGNDFHENDYIYLNNGDKTFKESMASMLNHATKFTMGVDVADMNNDGLMDIFTTDMFEDQYARNHFQLQQPGQTFSDIALMTNTYATDWSWSVLLQDFDNNGLADIFISNGIVKRPNDLDYINFVNQIGHKANKKLNAAELDQFLDKMPAQKLQNLLFLQEEELEFASLTASQIGTPTFSNGAAYADLDKDGDLDLVINNINQSVSLWENTNTTANNFIAFQLKDKPKTSKGAIIEVFSEGKSQRKYYTTTRGYQASSSHFVHFGLGKGTTVDSVNIIWPDQTKQTVLNLPINQYHAIEKAATVAYVIPQPAKNKATLAEFPLKHLENKFEDYNADKLIPELLSREGPAVVYADFNQDGKEDLFIGGARYQKPSLMIQKDEDVAAAAIDFDKDGDLDLYVVSGGNDEKELNKDLEDRLYLNDGNGNMKRTPISLPHTNGSTIAVGDFDKDGFDDLFIGARSMPSFYGLSPYSFILRNKGGFGVEIAKKQRFGMVTHSQWADIDNDNDLDLVFCGDWLNISILENQGDGELVYQANKIGLGETAGLWNTFYLKDLNADGWLDIIAGNTGTNFKWKASTEKPVKLYMVDLDKNGKPDPIIFHYYFSKYKPFASLDKLIAQAPAIRKQFVNYTAFSEVQDIADFTQITSEDIIETKFLMELRSMIYLSENGKYKGIPLPKAAQMSTIQGLTMDEKGSLIFVGNHHDYLTELGKSMGNSGGILSDFEVESGHFKNYESLNLPTNLNTRGITPIGKNRYFISCNNEVQYILNR